MPQTHYAPDEIVRQGHSLYEERIRSCVERDHRGEFVALNVETGDYEIDPDEIIALRRAKAKDADAPLYLLRIGFSAAYKLGKQLQASEH